MKNIDFTDFFNVFLSGATIRGRLFYYHCLLYSPGVAPSTFLNILEK